jgi:hypothetical protein
VFVGNAKFGLVDDCDLVVDGRVDRDRFGKPRRGAVNRDDRGVERATFCVGDVLRRRVSQWSRNGRSPVRA